MAAFEDDHYRLLGVDPLASTEELRRAWRQLALQWHPDHAGPQAAPRFRQLVAAYAVLSDAASRAAYDGRRRAGDASSRRPVDDARAAVESARAPAVMMSWLSGSLDSLMARGIARRVGPHLYDLHLDHEEWAEGGMAMISMKVALHCPSCSTSRAEGKMSSAADHCRRCGGSGQVRELFSAWLAIRPRLGDGTLLAPSASLPGMIHALGFRVRREA